MKNNGVKVRVVEFKGTNDWRKTVVVQMFEHYNVYMLWLFFLNDVCALLCVYILHALHSSGCLNGNANPLSMAAM